MHFTRNTEQDSLLLSVYYSLIRLDSFSVGAIGKNGNFFLTHNQCSFIFQEIRARCNLRNSQVCWKLQIEKPVVHFVEAQVHLYNYSCYSTTRLTTAIFLFKSHVLKPGIENLRQIMLFPLM